MEYEAWGTEHGDMEKYITKSFLLLVSLYRSPFTVFRPQRFTRFDQLKLCSISLLFAHSILAPTNQPQRTMATSNNHHAKARKIMTVKSFGVGEGIIFRKFLLPFRACVVPVQIWEIFFLRPCSLFLNSDSDFQGCETELCNSLSVTLYLDLLSNYLPLRFLSLRMVNGCATTR